MKSVLRILKDIRHTFPLELVVLENPSTTFWNKRSFLKKKAPKTTAQELVKKSP